MPHISEGDLHTYLDGALSATDPEAEGRLTAHLARCADCRARLERERAIHDRSTELLAAALPEVAEIPPFESLRGSGVRGGGTGASGGRSRLAWAASVAVALGAGWMGHAILGGSGDTIPDARLASEAPALSPEGRPSVARDADAADGEAARETAMVETPDAAADAVDVAPGAGAGRERTDAGAARDEPEAEPAAPPPSLENVTGAAESASAAKAPEEGAGDERRAVGQRREAEEAESVALQAPQAAVSLDAVVPDVVDAGADVQARGEVFAGAAWRPATREEAAEWVGRPLLAVQGLAVLEITIAEVDGLRLARVRQALPDDAPLELVLERTAAGFADRDRVEVAPEPRRRLGELRVAERVPGDAMPAAIWRRVGLAGAAGPGGPIEGVRAVIDGAWVTLAAPVASDSLRAIVSRVHRLETP